MCGIVGYTGPQEAITILLDSLKRLEYRGYDSAGVAVAQDAIGIYKEKGQISKLEANIPQLEGRIGIGHTRWATCGPPSKENAHPFISNDGRIALVHNGIIENHMALRKALGEKGYEFSSGTDTEVLVHLISDHLKDDLHAAVREALSEIRGTYAIVVVERGSRTLVAARRDNPLVVGLGVGENFLASDVTALLSHTNKVLYMMDGETAIVTPEGATIFDISGDEVSREPAIVTWAVEDAQRGGFEHFMLKEIYEQPVAIANTLVSYLDEIEMMDLLPVSDLATVKFVACGTSYHAAMVGKYVIEELVKVPTTVELASEYRYSPGAKESPLVVVITQSGETLDTLAACKEAKRRGCPTMAITNVVGSTITREADAVLYTRSGPEIGVAATKTYTSQLVAIYLLAMRMACQKGTMHADRLRRMKSELRSLPSKVKAVLDRAEEVERASGMIAQARDVFFIGRNINFPSMLEGALKLKEISYIHAEGYAAGELKHGPLALLTATTPVVASCINDHTYDKMVSNVSEVAARGSQVLVLGNEGNRELEMISDRVITIPDIPPLFSPVLLAVVLQLLAYHSAKKLGCPIDKPRNLAKSVTVE
jgi:glucosamine--fructose-6-phosphate aminotransferase (isomerizing)